LPKAYEKQVCRTDVSKRHVRFGSKADVTLSYCDVRSYPESGHVSPSRRRLLSATTGHHAGGLVGGGITADTYNPSYIEATVFFMSRGHLKHLPIIVVEFSKTLVNEGLL
jgi:hypothetical protein